MSLSADNLGLSPSTFSFEFHEWPLTRKQEQVAQSAGFQSSLYAYSDEEERFIEQEEKSRQELFEHLEQLKIGQGDEDSGAGLNKKGQHRSFFRWLFRK